jgi:hypothetical protein
MWTATTILSVIFTKNEIFLVKMKSLTLYKRNDEKSLFGSFNFVSFVEQVCQYAPIQKVSGMAVTSFKLVVLTYLPSCVVVKR